VQANGINFAKHKKIVYDMRGHLLRTATLLALLCASSAGRHRGGELSRAARHGRLWEAQV